MKSLRVVVMLMSGWMVFGAAGAAAQSDVVFSTLGIGLWPDYDQPGVLVIYRANIAPGVALPARLTFRIPAAAGAPAAMAERQTNGQLVTLPFDRRVEGDTAFIDVTVTRPVLQLEYYDPALARDGAVRRFIFRWPGDYDVGALSISAQQPDLAQNLTTAPAATTQGAGADGLMYHTISLAAVDAGTVVDVEISYEKVSDQLSVETMLPVDPQPTTPVAGSGGEASDTRLVLILMAALMGIAIVALAATVLRSRRTAAPPGGATPGAAEATTTARFCTQCGGEVGPGDRFCHRCGAPVG